MIKIKSIKKILSILKKENGSAIVEFNASMILIFLILNMALFLEMAAYQKLSLNMASREGARIYKYSGGDRAKAISVTQNELKIGGVEAKVDMNGGEAIARKEYSFGLPIVGGVKIHLEGKYSFKDELTARQYNKGWDPD